MAHFAELDENNVVLRVIVVADEKCLDEDGVESEAAGAAFCHRLLGGRWVKTSYNTYANTHVNGGTPFRKNFAGVGFVYDAARDAFIPPKQRPDDVFDEATCCWLPANPTAIELGVTRVESPN